MMREMQNAESGPDDGQQVIVRSYPGEKVDMNRLPSELCWSQSFPLTCPTTSAALGSNCFQTVRGHLQSYGSVNKPWEAQSGLVTAKQWSHLLVSLLELHIHRSSVYYVLTFTCTLVVQQQEATTKNASWLQCNIKQMAAKDTDNIQVHGRCLSHTPA